MASSSKQNTFYSWLQRFVAQFGGDRMSLKTVALLVVVVLACYGNTTQNGYSIDDDLIIDAHPQAESGFSALSEIFTTNYLSHGTKQGSYRALPRATYAIEYALWGHKPGISHGINIFLFLITCLLIVSLLSRLFPNGNGLAILCAVLLFAVHPLHTEVIASLKNRDELMQLMFSLLACIGLISYARHGKTASLILSSLAFLSSLACKETGIQFFAIYPIVFFYAGEVNKKRAIASSILFASVVALFGIFMVTVLNPEAVFWMNNATEEFLFIEHPLMHTSDLSIRIGTAFYGLLLYLKLYLIPYPLGFYYGYNQISLVPITSMLALASIVIYAVLSTIGIVGIRSRSPYSFAIFIMLICLAIFSNLVVQVSGIIAERYAYSSSMGFCILVGWIVQALSHRLSNGLKWGVLVPFTMVLVVFSGLTIERNKQWKNYLTLANQDSKTFTESAVVHFYLARYVENHVLDTATVNRVDWWRKAAYSYGQASRVHPSTTWSALYAADIYFHELHDLDSALIMYDALFYHGNLDRQSSASMLSYGACLKEKNRFTDAIRIYKLHTESFPYDIVAYERLLEILFVSDDDNELEKLLSITLAQFPTSDLPYIYRGNLANQKGDSQEAIDWYEKAIELNPPNEQLKNFILHLSRSNQIN
jgi:hypothetical protein